MIEASDFLRYVLLVARKGPIEYVFFSVLQVLLPTNSLDTVPPPGSGLTGGQPAGQPGIGSLFPGLRIGNKQTKAAGRCSQAFLDAANKQNLTFLVQVCFLGLLGQYM